MKRLALRLGVLLLGGAGVAAAVTACREVTATAVDVASIEIQPATRDMDVGQSVKFTARLLDDEGRELRRDVSWDTDVPAVATVSDDGTVTAHAPGQATLTASAGGKTGQALIRVGTPAVASVEISPPGGLILTGDSALFTAIAKAANGAVIAGKTASWGTTDPSIAVARPSGWVRAVAVGSTMITATIDGVRGEAEITVGASVGTVVEVDILPDPAEVPVTDTLRLRAIARGPNSTIINGRPTTWTSSNTAVAEIDGGGKVTAHRVGTTTIRATVDGVTAETTLEVLPVEVIISPSRATVLVDGTIQLNAALRATNGVEITGRTFTWKSAEPAIASVDPDGLVTAHAVGTSTIEAASGSFTGTASIFVVAEPVNSVTITPKQPSVIAGDTIILSAELRDPDGDLLTNHPVTWTSADESIARVEQTGPRTQQARVIGTFDGQVRITATAENRSDTTTVTVTPRTELELTMSASPANPAPGDPITYTLRIANKGPSISQNAVLTDTLPAGVTVEAGTSPGGTQSGDIYTWTLPAIQPGMSIDRVLVISGSPAGTVRNAANVTASVFERDLSNNYAQSSTTVGAADLQVTMTPSTTSPSAGEVVSYTIVVTNAGPAAAPQVVLTDDVPANVKVVNVGGGVQSGNQVTWDLATLQPGQQVTHQIDLEAPVSGSFTNMASLTGNVVDGNTANNQAAVPITVLGSDVSVRVTGPGTSVVLQAITDTLWIANSTVSGNALTVSATATVQGSVPVVTAALIRGTGTCSVSSVTVTATAASMMPGDTLACVISFTPLLIGAYTVQASVSSATADPDPSNNAASLQTDVTLIPAPTAFIPLPPTLNAAIYALPAVGLANAASEPLDANREGDHRFAGRSGTAMRAEEHIRGTGPDLAPRHIAPAGPVSALAGRLETGGRVVA